MKVSWHLNKEVDVLVKQVYAYVFYQGEHNLRVLVLRDRTSFTLPGGKPEGSESPPETLHREVFEEARVRLVNPVYLGYQRVDSDPSSSASSYAQLRYVAQLACEEPMEPDPATGRMYERRWCTLEEALMCLNWGSEGGRQIQDAFSFAKSVY